MSMQRQYGMRSLPNTSIHDKQWEWNPRSFDFESNTYPQDHMFPGAQVITVQKQKKKHYPDNHYASNFYKCPISMP